MVYTTCIVYNPFLCSKDNVFPLPGVCASIMKYAKVRLYAYSLHNAFMLEQFKIFSPAGWLIRMYLLRGGAYNN